jgi:hypothetical protein
MKICPRCQKTYTDDNLNFCLEDGTVLNPLHDQTSETVQINQPRVTTPQPHITGQPAQSGWNQPQQYSMQPPKKSSKTWVWVLLVLGSVVLLCGGGFIGLLAFIGSQADPANRSNANSNIKSLVPGNSSNSNAAPTGRTDITSVDLDIFVKEFSPYGTTTLNQGELTMGAKQKGFYYVLVAPDDYKTEDADTRVTIRNIDNASGTLGYGLIFHSNPTPLQQGYAFLIDSKRKRYRVVNHTPKKEATVVSWTNSNLINEGTAENMLEVRDLDDKIELYINGTMVKSIRNEHGYPGGVVGLYSGDGLQIAFKDLEIRK